MSPSLYDFDLKSIVNVIAHVKIEPQSKIVTGITIFYFNPSQGVSDLKGSYLLFTTLTHPLHNFSDPSERNFL